MRVLKIAAGAALAACLATAPSISGAIEITSTTPAWSNVVGGSNILLNSVNGDYLDVRWGSPAGNTAQSGLGFDPANPPAADYPVDTAFKLGDLRHYNFPIFNAASSVDLSLLTSITGATPLQQTFAFRFLIDETPNESPCAYPSTTPCADRITFQNLDLTSAFVIGGVSYTIQLLGFGNTATSFLSYFDSQENGTNTVGLWARITAAQSVPEPGTLALLGLGLVGLGLSRRRKAN